MEKQQIVKVLKSMLVDWRDSEKHFKSEIIESNFTELGFCLWLIYNQHPQVKNFIIAELKKDLEIESNSRYFYPTYEGENLKTKEIFTNRVNHLNRTISRLEKELLQ